MERSNVHFACLRVPEEMVQCSLFPVHSSPHTFTTGIIRRGSPANRRDRETGRRAMVHTSTRSETLLESHHAPLSNKPRTSLRRAAPPAPSPIKCSGESHQGQIHCLVISCARSRDTDVHALALSACRLFNSSRPCHGRFIDARRARSAGMAQSEPAYGILRTTQPSGIH
jgi:hypothetical protein